MRLPEVQPDAEHAPGSARPGDLLGGQQAPGGDCSRVLLLLARFLFTPKGNDGVSLEATRHMPRHRKSPKNPHTNEIAEQDDASPLLGQ